MLDDLNSGTANTIPTLGQQARAAALLDTDTELQLAYAWRDQRCEESLRRLTMAYLRLAIGTAKGFRRYKVPMDDLIQDACLGMMEAADRFEPERGLRFSTYALWWMRAELQKRVMRDWSLVKTGTTARQKQLFFHFRRVRTEVELTAAHSGEHLTQAELYERIAEQLDVPVADVEDMAGRLSGGDASLNVQLSDEESGAEWIDSLEDKSAIGAEQASQQNDTMRLRSWLVEALKALTDRERVIVKARKLQEPPRTLEDLGNEFDVSKERVRQIEVRALEKMQAYLKRHAPAAQGLL